MMHLRLIRAFISASAQEEAAYRANFYISLLHSLLNFATGLLGLGLSLIHISEPTRPY